MAIILIVIDTRTFFGFLYQTVRLLPYGKIKFSGTRVPKPESTWDPISPDSDEQHPAAPWNHQLQWFYIDIVYLPDSDPRNDLMITLGSDDPTSSRPFLVQSPTVDRLKKNSIFRDNPRYVCKRYLVKPEWGHYITVECRYTCHCFLYFQAYVRDGGQRVPFSFTFLRWQSNCEQSSTFA